MKIALQCVLPILLAVSLLTDVPAFARGNHGGHRGHHYGGHGRSHFSTLPATAYSGHYCPSLNRRVHDARECPELNMQPPPETPATNTYRENR